MQTTTRNATLEDLAALLTDQHAHKLDMIVPASKLRAEDGVLVVAGAEPVVDDHGVTPADGRYRPTVVCDEGIAAKLEIPVGYLKRLRTDRPDLYDANVNGWLHGFGNTPGEYDRGHDVFPADARSFMLRCFRGDDGEGVARALLSDKYRAIDHLDVLTAALEGVRDTGTEVDIIGCDLTDRRMFVRIAAPEIAALAPRLLDGYRSPFAGPNGVQRPWDTAAGRAHGWLTPDEQPVVFAGFEISNSETGGGSFQIVPRIVLKVCTNGLTITADALQKVHLGGKLDEGIIRWSEDTQRKSLELVTAQARDAVTTYLDVDYVEMVLDRIDRKASVAITGDSADVVQTVCKQLKFTEERTAGILDHFIRGGQLTAGGVMQAVTSYAQIIVDADEAHDLEAQALRVLDVAARVAA